MHKYGVIANANDTMDHSGFAWPPTHFSFPHLQLNCFEVKSSPHFLFFFVACFLFWCVAVTPNVASLASSLLASVHPPPPSLFISLCLSCPSLTLPPFAFISHQRSKVMRCCPWSHASALNILSAQVCEVRSLLQVCKKCSALKAVQKNLVWSHGHYILWCPSGSGVIVLAC